MAQLQQEKPYDAAIFRNAMPEARGHGMVWYRWYGR